MYTSQLMKSFLKNPLITKITFPLHIATKLIFISNEKMSISFKKTLKLGTLSRTKTGRDININYGYPTAKKRIEYSSINAFTTKKSVKSDVIIYVENKLERDVDDFLFNAIQFVQRICAARKKCTNCK
jgi:hypothetical protein